MTLLGGNWARIEEIDMLYAGLDVSSARTAVCVLDAAGKQIVHAAPPRCRYRFRNQQRLQQL